MLIYMYSEMGTILAYNLLVYLCLCQLEGLVDNPFLVEDRIVFCFLTAQLL